MEIKASIKNYRQSPRKLRLIANLIRGKKVDRAISELNHLNKKASIIVKKLLESALANAKHNNNLKKEDLFLKKIVVDSGPSLKRFRPGARGVAYPYKKRTSNISVVLGEDVKEPERIKPSASTKGYDVTKKDEKIKTIKKVIKK
ncbi:MAG: 50S ribosomal protein L22 [Candidatus Pacebacteria bacterium]|nr:50S ribosomal protein L22 [Candidatus Paceibacterota bacterium]